MSVLVGAEAPDFTAPAVLGSGEIINDLNLREYTKDSYSLVFFYPLDFTFVCPSELIALDRVTQQFEERNVKVVAVSIDSHFTHNAWRNTPVNAGGIGPVQYALVSDLSHSICQSYGIQHPQGVAYRGTFLVDRDNIVRAQIVNDLPLGRNMDEILRLVDALQYTEKHGEVCPANWQQGDAAMTPSPSGVASYLSNHMATEATNA